MRVLALSDVHTDHKQNQQWVEELSSTDFLHDVLVVAGDISDQLHQLRATLISLREKFLEVFFCPGNHDLWHKRDERLNGVVSAHSIDRLQGLLQLCCEIGVKTEPAEVNGVWICPIFSWYHSDFDREPDIPGAYDITKVGSCLACSAHGRVGVLLCVAKGVRLMRVETRPVPFVWFPAISLRRAFEGSFCGNATCLSEVVKNPIRKPWNAHRLVILD
uniref:Metallo-dependent protein n=1 Tax=Tetraselmis sp. GSL018 TaxID=582737 RepID=A0A061RPM6_9CHLO